MRKEIKQKNKLKDNKILYWIIVGICIAFCFFGRFIPIPTMTAQSVGLVFIFIPTIILWMVSGLVWPSLLCLVALGFLGYGDGSTGFGFVIKSSFGDSTWVFLLFTFVLMFALTETPVFKRIALAFVNNNIARKNGHLFVFLFMLGVLLIGCFTSPTVLFALIYPILKEIFFLAKVKKGDKIGKYMILALCFTVSISSGMTPIAHVFCVQVMKVAQVQISMLQYTAFAFPLGLVAFLLMIGTFLLILKKKDVACLTNVNVASIKSSLPKMNEQELLSIIVFCVVIILWVLPSTLQSAAPEFYNFMNSTLGIAIPPLIGSTVLAIIEIKNKKVLDVVQAMKSNVPWSSLLVCAAALAIGAAFKPTGLSATLETAFQQGFGNVPAIALFIILIIWTLVETNFSSNLVTATVVATITLNLQKVIAVSLNYSAVVAVLGCLSGLAFATPPGHPNVALTVDSEYADGKQTLGFGMMTAGYSAIAAIAVGYPIAMCVM